MYNSDFVLKSKRSKSQDTQKLSSNRKYFSKRLRDLSKMLRKTANKLSRRKTKQKQKTRQSGFYQELLFT